MSSEVMAQRSLGGYRAPWAPLISFSGGSLRDS